MCPANGGIKDSEPFLSPVCCFALHLTFNDGRDLLARVADLLRPFVEITNLSNDLLMKLLLHCYQDLPNDLNKRIFELTIRFIQETGRFY